MCVIIMRYSIDPLMEILLLLILVSRQVKVLGQPERFPPEAAIASLLRELQREGCVQA